MPGSIDLVVFDLDGTLIDSRLDIASSANHTLHGAGYAELSTEEITSFVGDGARNLIARAAGFPVDDDRVATLLDVFLSHYRAHPVDHTVVLPDVVEVLERLTEYTLAVCTNKPRALTVEILTRLGLASFFETVCAGDDTEAKKPDPAPLLRICTTLGIAPARAVIVGDGWQDVVCGLRAGARTIGVEGMGSVDELRRAGPHALLPMKYIPAQLMAWRID